MSQYSIGVDFGGTNVKIGLVNGHGRIVTRSRLETKAFARNKFKLIQAIVASIEQLMAGHKLTKKHMAGIGIGVPGLVDPDKGMVKVLTNVPGWRNVSLRRVFQNKLDIPVHVDNDVNMVTLGEWRFGAGKGVDNLLCITLGTGVGGGLILDNRLYRGPGYAVGEVGHFLVMDKGIRGPFDGYDYLERLVGNAPLVQKAEKMFKRKGIRLEDVRALANQDNPQALQFWQGAATHIGNALVNVVNLLNPRLIIIGGGVSNNHKYLFPTIKQMIGQRAMSTQKNMVKVVRAKLGDDAGVIGAHVLVKGC